jgi:hypothetical protein
MLHLKGDLGMLAAPTPVGVLQAENVSMQVD